MRIDFARLNHILIPDTKTGRDRYRRGLIGAIARPIERTFRALTPAGRILSTAWLIVGAFGLEVRVAQIYLLWCAITGALLAGFLVRRFYRLNDVQLRTEHPPRVAIDERLDVTLVLENRTDRDHYAIAVDGPLLPWDGRYVGTREGLPVVEADSVGRVVVGLAFAARGEHHLDPFHVASICPLGLTFGPSLASGGLRFLVLPKIANVVRIDLDRTVRHQPGGVALASHTGEARELVGLRPYRPGDPIRDLAYRAWARLGVPVVREYQQEYFTRLGLILDTDATVGDPRFEAAIQLAAGVLAHLVRGDVLVDLMIVGGSLHRLTLGRSLGRLEQALDLLAVVEPSDTFDAETTLGLLSPHLDRLSSVVMVAMHDDEPRRRVVDEVRRRGVGCRALTIDTDVTVEAIESGEAISL